MGIKDIQRTAIRKMVIPMINDLNWKEMDSKIEGFLIDFNKENPLNPNEEYIGMLIISYKCQTTVNLCAFTPDNKVSRTLKSMTLQEFVKLIISIF